VTIDKTTAATSTHWFYAQADADTSRCEATSADTSSNWRYGAAPPRSEFRLVHARISRELNEAPYNR